ncbi:M1-specific T cell receptor beta chain-like [Engraulis encrasicolus]|uniref:M1-specific T cell receptor beta chain-like n=1 Tax=Engraulis encrasicolus TaxID=184585 RepID=UPI002FD65370
MCIPVKLRIAMTASHLLLCAVLAQANSFIVTQSPDVEVTLGSSASLHCDIGELYSKCSRVVWLKLDPRKPMALHMSDRVEKVDQSNGKDITWVSVCRATIPDATMNDAGMYYCVVSQGSFAHVGNGTRLTVTEPVSSSLHGKELPPSIEIVPPVAYTSAVLLLCLVSGVHPSQARVSWLIEGSVEGGWAVAALEEDNGHGPPRRFTQKNQVLIPAETWERGVACSCVVQIAGQSFSKTLHYSREPDRCDAVFYIYVAAWVMSSLFLLMLLGVMAVHLCRPEA